MTRMTLTPNQSRMVDQFAASVTGSSLNASEMGTGKTLVAVELALRLRAEFILVIAPVNTLDSWTATFKRQGFHLPVRRLDSTAKGKEAFDLYAWNAPGVYLIGHEMLTRNAADRMPDVNGDGTYKEKNGKPVYRYVERRTFRQEHDMVILDESHKAQNRDSRFYKSLMTSRGRILINGKHRHAMSGTPTGNSFSGAWAPTRWLFPDNVEPVFLKWVAQWCATKYDAFAPNNMKVTGEKTPGAFFNSLPAFAREEAPKTVPVEHVTHTVELTETQRTIYDTMVNDSIAWLEGEPLVADVPIAVRTRARQITLAVPTIDAEGGVDFAMDTKSTKLDRLEDVIDHEIDEETALILTDSAKFARVTEARIASWGYKVARWDGSVSHKKRAEIKQAFLDGGVDYLVGVIAAMGTGTDGLQHATRNVIWLSESDSGVDNEQALARIDRRGQTLPVRSIKILAHDTLDDGVTQKLIQDAIARRASVKEV